MRVVISPVKILGICNDFFANIESRGNSARVCLKMGYTPKLSELDEEHHDDI